jgi:hypothetical protein
MQCAEGVLCSCSMAGAVPGQEGHSGRQLLSAARMLALQQTERLEALSEHSGYLESLLQEDAELQNEHYTDRCAFCHLVFPCRRFRLSVSSCATGMPDVDRGLFLTKTIPPLQPPQSFNT